MLDVTAADRAGSTAPRAAEVAPGVNPFVHVAGGAIVDTDGSPILLRGVGMGNWLLPEGYMWGFGDRTASPRQIEHLVRALLGNDGADRFWRQFRARFVAEADIARIAAEGFDHVRLPMNWRVLMSSTGAWLEDGFDCLDRLIDWCRTHGLRVLLDLHGAPGGQTGTNIDDSLGRPELFMDERNGELTVELWTEIARRYRDEPTVLGYDLLNEPLPDQWQHRFAEDLVALYRRVTAAVRRVDPHHLIMYEGMHWATSWDIFTEVWDHNSVLQFHKYWSPADRPSIQRFLDVGAQLGLPVYMGEGGENIPEWLAAAFQLYEDCGIGWNFWPWKKIATLSSPCSVTAPEGWDRVIAFADGTAGPPARADAERIFTDLLGAVELRSCEYRPEVVNALFRRAPVALPAYGFTFRGAGVSYEVGQPDTDPVVRADETVALRRRDGAGTADFSYPPVDDEGATVVADLEAGQWIEFEVELAAGSWDVSVVTEAGLGTADEAPILSAGGVVLTARGADLAAGRRSWSGTVVQGGTARIAIRVLAPTGGVTVASVDVRHATT